MTFKLPIEAECDRQDKADCHHSVVIHARNNFDAAEELDRLGWWVGEHDSIICPACRD